MRLSIDNQLLPDNCFVLKFLPCVATVTHFVCLLCSPVSSLESKETGWNRQGPAKTHDFVFPPNERLRLWKVSGPPLDHGVRWSRCFQVWFEILQQNILGLICSWQQFIVITACKETYSRSRIHLAFLRSGSTAEHVQTSCKVDVALSKVKGREITLLASSNFAFSLAKLSPYHYSTSSPVVPRPPFQRDTNS